MNKKVIGIIAAIVFMISCGHPAKELGVEIKAERNPLNLTTVIGDIVGNYFLPASAAVDITPFRGNADAKKTLLYNMTNAFGETVVAMDCSVDMEYQAQVDGKVNSNIIREDNGCYLACALSAGDACGSIGNPAERVWTKIVTITGKRRVKSVDLISSDLNNSSMLSSVGTVREPRLRGGLHGLRVTYEDGTQNPSGDNCEDTFPGETTINIGGVKLTKGSFMPTEFNAEGCAYLFTLIAENGAIIAGTVENDPDGDGYDDYPADCGPDNPAIYPGAPETDNDGIDSNCDGDDNNPVNPVCVNGMTQVCGIDTGACQTGIQTCANSSWGVCVGAIGPVTEICGDNIDNDCDGSTDGPAEGCTNPIICYYDGDGDGFGLASNTQNSTTGTCPLHFVTVDSDCNDQNAAVRPGVTENCTDNIDNNCNGLVDSQDPVCTIPVGDNHDDDGDCYCEVGPCNGSVNRACATVQSGDCDDTKIGVNPGVVEVPANGIDDNCNNLVDEPAPNGNTDSDGDGYTPNEGDCNDANAAVHPGATGAPNDGIDSNCDGYDYDNAVFVTISTDASGGTARCFGSGCEWGDILFTGNVQSATVLVNEGLGNRVCVQYQLSDGSVLSDGFTPDPNNHFRAINTATGKWLYANGQRLEFVEAQDGTGENFCFMPILRNGVLTFEQPIHTGGYRLEIEFGGTITSYPSAKFHFGGGIVSWPGAWAMDSNYRITLDHQIPSEFKFNSDGPVFSGHYAVQVLSGQAVVFAGLTVTLRSYRGNTLVDTKVITSLTGYAILIGGDIRYPNFGFTLNSDGTISPF